MFSALILGRRRQGKSTLSLAIARARAPTVVVFDPNAQFDGFGLTSVESLPDEMEQDEAVLVVRPDPGAVLEDWQAVAEILWRYEDYALILDEASVVQQPGWCDPWLERFLRQAPDSVSLIQNTHRAVDLVKLSRALATDLFLFRTTLEADLRLLSSEFPGLDIGRVACLPPYHVVHYTWDGRRDHNYIWDDPGSWFWGGDSSGSGGGGGTQRGRSALERSPAAQASSEPAPAETTGIPP